MAGRKARLHLKGRGSVEVIVIDLLKFGVRINTGYIYYWTTIERLEWIDK